VRASMGSVFARPPARAELAGLAGMKLALDGGAPTSLADLEVGSAGVAKVAGRRPRPDSDAPRRPGLAQCGDGRHRGTV
jgi:hypothetical protein